MNARLVIVVLSFVWVVLPRLGWCVFDPQRDVLDGMGNTILPSDPSALELLSLPVATIAPGELKIETGYSRKFAMKEFDRIYGAASVRFGSWTTAVGVSQFGRSELYAEKTVRAAMSRRFDSLAFGLSMSAVQLEFGGGYDNLSAATVGLSCGYNTERLKVAAACENLTRPRLSSSGPKTNIVSTLYLELLGPGPYSIAGRLTLETTEKPQMGLGQKIRLSSYGRFFWGVATEPTTYGGGVEVDYRGYTISVAATYHPVLGLSHLVALRISR